MTAAIRRTKLAVAKTRVAELEALREQQERRIDLAYEAMSQELAIAKARIAELEASRPAELAAARDEALRDIIEMVEARANAQLEGARRLSSAVLAYWEGMNTGAFLIVADAVRKLLSEAEPQRRAG